MPQPPNLNPHAQKIKQMRADLDTLVEQVGAESPDLNSAVQGVKAALEVLELRLAAAQGRRDFA